MGLLHPQFVCGYLHCPGAVVSLPLSDYTEQQQTGVSLHPEKSNIQTSYYILTIFNENPWSIKFTAQTSRLDHKILGLRSHPFCNMTMPFKKNDKLLFIEFLNALFRFMYLTGPIMRNAGWGDMLNFRCTMGLQTFLKVSYLESSFNGWPMFWRTSKILLPVKLSA